MSSPLPKGIAEQAEAFEALLAQWDHAVTLVADDWGRFSWQVRRDADDPGVHQAAASLNMRWARLHADGYKRYSFGGKAGWLPKSP